MFRRIGLYVGVACTASCSSPEGPLEPGTNSYSVSARDLVAVTVDDLAIPEGYGIDVNTSGVVVGGREEDNGTSGFIWRAVGGAESLGGFSDRYTSAQSINAAGEVVGSSTPAGTLLRIPFLRKASGEFMTLEATGAQGFANAINDAGIVAGNIHAEGRTRAFRWSADDGLKLLDDLGGDFNQGISINSRGEIAGTSNFTGGSSRAVVWSSTGELRQLRGLTGTYATARDINDVGQVAGISHSAGGSLRAVVWDANGQIRDIGTLGGEWGYAYGINNHGEVVGVTSVAGGSYRAFFWSEASGMLDLGVLPGRNHSWAMRINDAGQIVGWSGGTATLWQVTRPGEPR